MAEQTIGSLVRSCLGPQGKHLSEEELERLVRDFAAAGRRELTLPSASPKEAAEAIDKARHQLASARLRLSQVSAISASPVVIQDEWQPHRRALDRQLRRLRRFPGVVGASLSYRRRAGQLTSERCVTVFVREKQPRAAFEGNREHLLPETLATGERGVRIPVDVVQFGNLLRLARAGEAIAALETGEFGTIGGFAVDPRTGKAVALTAMHISRLHEYPVSQTDPAVPFHLVAGGPAGAVRLGSLLRGTLTGTDAACITVDPPEVALNDVLGVGPINGWRRLSVQGDRGAAVRMFGAATSRPVTGFIEEPLVKLPEEGLDAAILVDISARPGDSGAALVDREGLLLGLLVGQSSQRQDWMVFTPIGVVLRKLQCTLATR